MYHNKGTEYFLHNDNFMLMRVQRTNKNFEKYRKKRQSMGTVMHVLKKWVRMDFNC